MSQSDFEFFKGEVYSHLLIMSKGKINPAFAKRLTDTYCKPCFLENEAIKHKGTTFIADLILKKHNR